MFAQLRANGSVFACPVLQADQTPVPKKLLPQCLHTASQQLFIYRGTSLTQLPNQDCLPAYELRAAEDTFAHWPVCRQVTTRSTNLLGSHQKSRTNTNGRNWYQSVKQVCVTRDETPAVKTPKSVLLSHPETHPDFLEVNFKVVALFTLLFMSTWET